MSRLFLILAALGGVGIPLFAPRFPSLFSGIFGRQYVLPSPDPLVLRFYPLLLLVASLVAITAFYLSWRYRRTHIPPLALTALLGFILLQAFVTACALVLPTILAAKQFNGAP